MDFLWVRWFGRELSHRVGWSKRRLHQIGFVEDHEDTPAFGFIHPSQVLRGAHLIPAFAHGKTNIMLPPSVARPVSDNDEDWKFYYVNMFVDRDMFMRYRGGGVGHKVTRSSNRALLEETHAVEPDSEEAELGPPAPVGPLGDEEWVDEPELDEDGDGFDDETYGFGLTESDHGNDEPDNGSDDEGCDGAEDELGAEDGEEPGEDFEGEEGFAPL
ncbi:hypothetical protein SCHPADRAFT_822793 [Schizopora paradoxa]|uniref:Uncharacterized protein n=1 Tax=Schizopora paradoxa TaxID=27342 RepID=A0A0H2RX94_9AGAM|nr:hypothetical protein SCHPADRAFT_822793 [Schizopora paradoxa]